MILMKVSLVQQIYRGSKESIYKYNMILVLDKVVCLTFILYYPLLFGLNISISKSLIIL